MRIGRRKLFVVTLIILFCQSFGGISVNDCESQTVNGGWTSAEPLSDVCNLTVLDIDDLTLIDFQTEWQHRPFVLRSASTRQDRFRRALARDTLLQSHGDKPVVLSSSNTFSYDKRHTTLRSYVAEMRDGANDDVSTNATDIWYLFGDLDDQHFKDLLDLYTLPPFVDDRPVALSFGIGAHRSGVALHVHGPVWAETIYGHKEWILIEPNATPTFDPTQRSVDWNVVDEHLRCTLAPGEILWIPDQWWHATINIGETVFISAFV